MMRKLVLEGLIACPLIACAVMSEPTAVYTNPDATVLWRTLTSPTETIRWDFPKGADRATLSVSGYGYERVYADLAVSSLALDLPVAADALSERVFELVLTFNDVAGTVWRAKVGLVQGVASGGSAVEATARFVPADTKLWPRAGKTNVLEIPAGTETLTYDGQVLETGLDGAAGWYFLGPLPADGAGVTHELRLDDWTASICVWTRPGLLLIFK